MTHSCGIKEMPVLLFCTKAVKMHFNSYLTRYRKMEALSGPGIYLTHLHTEPMSFDRFIKSLRTLHNKDLILSLPLPFSSTLQILCYICPISAFRTALIFSYWSKMIIVTFFFKEVTKSKSKLCWAYIHGVGTIHWSVVDLSGTHLWGNRTSPPLEVSTCQ